MHIAHYTSHTYTHTHTHTGADSTSPWSFLRDNLCSSSRWKCVTSTSISLEGAGMMVHDAPIARMRWAHLNSSNDITMDECPGLGVNSSKPWWHGLLNAPRTVEAVKMVDSVRNATVFFQSYSLRSIVNPTSTPIIHYTMGQPLGYVVVIVIWTASA